MKTIFVDLGGTLILNRNENGILNEKLFKILLKNKARLQLAVISDTSYDVTQVLHDFGITETFKPFVITKYLFSIDKNSPDAYFFACNKIGTAPKDCLLIDNEQGFIQAASIAGMVTLSPDDDCLESRIEKFLSE